MTLFTAFYDRAHFHYHFHQKKLDEKVLSLHPPHYFFVIHWIQYVCIDVYGLTLEHKVGYHENHLFMVTKIREHSLNGQTIV